MMHPLWLAFLIALGIALIATRLVIILGISDAPDEARKNHVHITPTSGGLGIMAGFLAAIVYLGWTGNGAISPTIVAVLIVASLSGILGLRDDIKPLGSKFKLSLMVFGALCLVMTGVRIENFDLGAQQSFLLGPILGGLGTLFWLLVMVNTVNFMDGANGMAMGCAGLGLLGLGALGFMQGGAGLGEPPFVALGFIAFGACLGFLFWNAWRGAIFAGDCGSLFVGFLCGGVGALAVMAGISPLCVVMCFLPMLTDVILTIVRRLRHGDNILTAHSKHAYQTLIRAGATHLQTSSRYWLQTLLGMACALLGAYKGGFWPLGLSAALTFLLSLSYLASLRLAIRLHALNEKKD